MVLFHNALKLAHLLAIIVWVGGMVFAHFFLRPAAQSLEPPQRLRLMHDVAARFDLESTDTRFSLRIVIPL